jgi:hypothetical protein
MPPHMPRSSSRNHSITTETDSYSSNNHHHQMDVSGK